MYSCILGLFYFEIYFRKMIGVIRVNFKNLLC